MPEEYLIQAGFVIISLRWLNGKIQEAREIDTRDRGRTCQKDVFERRCLEDSVIREVQGRIGFLKVMGNGKPRLQGLPVEKQLIVVPAQAGIDGPVVKPDQILHIDRLLQIRAIGLVCKSQRLTRVELRGVSD